MANGNQIITNALATVFGTMNEVFFDVKSITLLKMSEDEREYEEIRTVSKSWFLKYDDYRQQFRLEIAINNPGFNEDAQRATHIRVGGDVYAIKVADTVKPRGVGFSWKFYCEQYFSRSQYGAIY